MLYLPVNKLDLIVTTLVVCVAFTVIAVGVFMILSAVIGTVWAIALIATLVIVISSFLVGVYIGSKS